MQNQAGPRKRNRIPYTPKVGSSTAFLEETQPAVVDEPELELPEEEALLSETLVMDTMMEDAYLDDPDAHGHERAYDGQRSLADDFEEAEDALDEAQGPDTEEDGFSDFGEAFDEIGGPEDEY